jgi:hypothetical protein
VNWGGAGNEEDQDQFKAQVVLEVLAGLKSPSEIAGQHRDRSRQPQVDVPIRYSTVGVISSARSAEPSSGKLLR